MDFNAFDSVAAAERGAELHLKHPATGEPINDEGEPCVVIVRGAEGDTAQAAIRSALRARAKASEDEDAKTLLDVHKALTDAAKPLIMGFKNINRGDKPAGLDDVDWFLNLNRINGQEGEESFAEQINKFATKRANYLGNGSAA